MNWDHTLAVCVSYTANFHHCGEVTKVDNKGTCHRKFSVNLASCTTLEGIRMLL